MKKSTRIFLSFYLFTAASPLSILAQLPVFNHITVENGLSQNSVLSITQDKHGMMWFGTQLGLNKYDSRKFSIYRSENRNNSSLSNEYIIALLSDSKNVLWVGTQKGLNKYDSANDEFEHIQLSATNASENIKKINFLFEDSKNRLWVGIKNTLYLLIDRAKNTFSPISNTNSPAFPNGDIMCIYEDHAHTLWLSTTKGLIKMTGNFPNMKLDVLPYQNYQKTSDTSTHDDFVTGITEDNHHCLWMGTLNNGLKRYNIATGTWEHFIHSQQDANSLINNNIRRIFTDKNGDIWIGTQEGLTIWNHATGKFANCVHNPENKESLSQNSVYSIFQDKVGTIWIGTYFGGINSFDSYRTPFTTYHNGLSKNNLSNNVVSSIVEDDKQNLWVGTEGGGLNYLNRKTGGVTYYQHNSAEQASLSSNLVKIIYKDNDNDIWVGTHGGGLNLYDPKANNFIRFFYKENDAATLASEITCMKEDAQGQLWVGSQKGLMAFRKKGNTLVDDTESSSIIAKMNKAYIFFLFEDSKHNLWIGSDAGIYIKKNNQLQLIPNNNPTQYNVGYRFNCITEDVEKNIWIGTYYDGLCNYNLDGVIQNCFSKKDGLPDNNVLGILEDEKHNLWISTGNGLAKYDRAHHLFLHYFAIDGLAGNVFNNNSFYKSATGEMFFGGNNGLTSFWPSKIEENNIAPPVVLSSLNLFGKKVNVNDTTGLLTTDFPYTKNIVLKYGQNVFSVDFSVLNYVKPEKNRFAYMLKDYDKDWNYVDNPSASFTNLPAGNYTLLVKGSNNDGFWSNPVSLGIEVLPPFWKTWKAYCLYFILLALTIFFIVRFFFLREWVKKNNELTQLKLNFFTNISHEIKTHLSLIIGPAERLIQNASTDQDEQKQLLVIKHNSESLLQLVNELLDFRKAEAGNLKLHIANWDIVPFIKVIHASFQDTSASRNIKTDFNTNAESIEMWFDKEQLEKVFFNLLSNAYKFTLDGGNINISIEEKKTTIEIKVTDNGKGIAEENLEKLFDNYFQEEDHGKQNSGYGIGLALSKSIVEMHKGNIVVQSKHSEDEASRFTSFTVILAKGKEHLDASFIEDNGVSSYQNARVPIKLNEITESYLPLQVPAENKYTLLLVEDNSAIRSFIKEAFESQYHIIESTNGQQGWEMATETIPDLIISDVMMPEMDGISLCKKLKTDQRTSHIPLILLTAKNSTANQIKGLETGADLYLTKPFSIQVLALHVYNLIIARERLWKQFNISLTKGNNLTGEPILEEVSYNAEIQAMHPLDAAFLQDVVQIVEDNIYEPAFNIAILSTKIGMSQPVLLKKIKAVTGLSTNDFLKSLRLKKAAGLLLEKRHTVYEISFMVGYDDSKYFSKEFKKQFGKTPTEYAGAAKVKS